MKKEHNYGIDLLRIFLMFLIISGHLFTHTQIREVLEPYSSKWIFTWSFQTIEFCAVNCFILISGYFSNVSSSKIKLKKILQLYGQVLFYSVGIYLILLLTGVIRFSIVDAIHSLFPVLSGQYWFFSSYILLMLLMPFLNAMLSKLNNFSLKVLISIIIVVFYVVPLFAIVFVPYDMTEGMGIIGLVTLYIVGYSLKRFEVRLSKLKCVIGLVINCAIIFASKIVLTCLVNYLDIDAGTGLLYHYNTIFELTNAILLLILFKDIKVKGRIAKASKFFASSVFGIYLLHEHPSIRSIIWNTELYNTLLKVDLPIYICLTVFISIGLLLICFVIDKVRYYIGKIISKAPIINRLMDKLTTLENNINQRKDDYL